MVPHKCFGSFFVVETVATLELAHTRFSAMLIDIHRLIGNNTLSVTSIPQKMTLSIILRVNALPVVLARQCRVEQSVKTKTRKLMTTSIRWCALCTTQRLISPTLSMFLTSRTPHLPTSPRVSVTIRLILLGARSLLPVYRTRLVPPSIRTAESRLGKC